MKKLILSLSILIVILLTVGGGLFYWFAYRPSSVISNCAVDKQSWFDAAKAKYYKEGLLPNDIVDTADYHSSFIDTLSPQSGNEYVRNIAWKDGLKDKVQDAANTHYQDCLRLKGL